MIVTSHFVRLGMKEFGSLEFCGLSACLLMGFTKYKCQALDTRRLLCLHEMLSICYERNT